MDLNLNKITFDTGNGKKTLAKCTSEEFKMFLKQNDINVIESSGEWSITQREMILNLMVSTMQQLAELDNIELTEGEDDQLGIVN